jgi:hypothetical protein
MSKPGDTGIPNINQVKIMYTAQPSTIRFIHQMLDALKGKDEQGNVIMKLRRYVRKPDKSDNNVNLFSYKDSQGNQINFGFDRSVIIFNAADPAKRQLFILKGKLAEGTFGRVKEVVRGVDVISAQTGKESILKIIPFAPAPAAAADNQASSSAAK